MHVPVHDCSCKEVSRIFSKLTVRLLLARSGLCLCLSGLFVAQRLKWARQLRRKLLQFGGVAMERGDFFGDRGLKILYPNRLHLAKNISLGHDNCFWCFNDVYVGAWTQTAKDLLIISGSHENDSFRPKIGKDQEVVVGCGCWIGARVTILGGTVLGPGCIIAAGAVVKGRFPAFSIVGGVPAKIIGERVPADMITSPFGEYPVSELQ
jgi:acetyltransferase-like isoleucine patch superfamily enzyme